VALYIVPAATDRTTISSWVSSTSRVATTSRGPPLFSFMSLRLLKSRYQHNYAYEIGSISRLWHVSTSVLGLQSTGYRKELWSRCFVLGTIEAGVFVRGFKYHPILLFSVHHTNLLYSFIVKFTCAASYSLRWYFSYTLCSEKSETTKHFAITSANL